MKRAREPYDAAGHAHQPFCLAGLGDGYEPRLSAAMTTPSLNLTASTEVPVTIGEEVWALGPFVCRKDGSYSP